MRLLIGIATYKRIEKLKRLLHSLKNQTYQDFIIHIVCDNKDQETANYLLGLYEHRAGHISLSINDSHKFVVGAWNYVVRNYINTFVDFDGFIGLVDDVELRPNALEEIVKCHKDNFPDTDGVVGFNQKCYGHSSYTFKWFGQTLIGKKFIERYENVDYLYYAPMYKHFYADEELWHYASSLKKFVNCEHAILDHDHPSFTGTVDETHNIIRKGEFSPKEHDMKLWKERQEKGYIWGLNWNGYDQ